METVFQIVKRRDTPFMGTNEIITISEFNHRLKQGEELVILDDLVLDIS